MSHKPLTFRTASLKRGVFAIPVIWSVLISAPSTYAQIPCEYEVTIIQASECPPFGFPPTIGQAISEPIDGGLPNVVGYYQSCGIGPDTAFLWIGNEDDFITIPMPPGTTRSKALAISGPRIVGTYDNPELELGTTGFLYDFETDQFTSLGTLPGGNTSEAHAINSRGEIVGFWGDVVNGPFPLGFIWRKGKMIDIHPDFGTSRSVPSDINSKSLVTGWMGQAPQTDARAFVWDNGKVTELPPIPGGFTSVGEVVGDDTSVTGWGLREEGNPPETVTRAFLWQVGKMLDLGTLPDHLRSAALGMRISPLEIVGLSWNVLGNPNIRHAFVWGDGKMIDLNDLIPPDLGLNITVATGINAAGQIVATAVDQFSDVVAVLLTPINGPPGDLNNDCQVEVADLLILLSNWGPCDDCGNCPADLDGNCVVGVSDLLILLANWG